MTGTDVYKKLGVRPVINAWGVATELGGSTLTPSVQAAMNAANSSPVEMTELLSRSGDFIADRLGVEAAYVTSGAAAAQALSVAACMVGNDPDRILQLPDTTGLRNEVLIQKRNRYMFDRCFRLTPTHVGSRRRRRGRKTSPCATTEHQLATALHHNRMSSAESTGCCARLAISRLRGRRATLR